MGWVYGAEQPVHTCRPPMRTVSVSPPSTSLNPASQPPPPTNLYDFTIVDGAHGDLWRCDGCRKLWRIGLACDYCDAHQRDVYHRGSHAVGYRWRPATLWQRFTYRHEPRHLDLTVMPHDLPEGRE